MAMRMPQGGNLGDFGLKIQVNTGDLMRISSRIRGIPVRIHSGLLTRARAMTQQAVWALDDAAPEGPGGGWARGNPPLKGSHRGTIINAFQAVVYTVAPHARFIVQGFTAHMPPEHAWIGQKELSYVMRRAVLNNETPENPRDYFTPVARQLEVFNAAEAVRLSSQVIPP